jgi:nickel-dependent lactate racemase
MLIDLPYGEQTLRLDVPDRNLSEVLRPNDTHGLRLCQAEIDELREDIGHFLEPAKSVLVIVNDYTRPTPNADVLEHIHRELMDKHVWFLIACGSHTPPSEAQFRQVLGRFYDLYKEQVLVHDARDQSRLKFLGKTRSGTEVWVNDKVLQVDRLITINSVEPHYFAGYTGGRKSILPGISGIETITHNHKLSLVPEARAMHLTGNPVHEDMTEAAKMIPRAIFSIQVIIDNRRQLCTLRFGDLFESFEQAIPDADRVFCVPLKAKADIVVTCAAPPGDINFYQQQKSMEYGKLALKDGGILIGVSACRAGIGDDTFIRLLSSVKTPAEAIEKIRANFVLGYHKSAKLAEMMLTSEVWTVVPIADETVRSIFMKPYHDVNAALAEAIRLKGPDATVTVLPDGGLTVPLCNCS